MTVLTSTLFTGQSASAADALDLNPRYGVEPTDSGNSATAGLTWHDPVTGHPAGDVNDVAYVILDSTMDGVPYLAGVQLRCINQTAGGVAADWAPLPGGSTDLYLDRDPFGVRTSDPDAAAVGLHYTLNYGAGGSGFSLPPLASADIGDIITFTNVSGEPVMVAPQGGESLNGVVNNNTVVSQAAGEYWRVEKVSATEWLAVELTPEAPAATTETPLEWLSIRYDYDFSDAVHYLGSATTDQGGTYTVADLGSSKLSIEGQSSWVNGNTVVVPRSADYDVTVSFNDTTASSDFGLYVNGVQVSAKYSGNGSEPGRDWSQPMILPLTAGDVLEFGAESPDNPADPIGSFYWVVAQRPTSEVVPVGSVTPTVLDYATLGLDSNQNITPVGAKVVFDTLDVHAGTGISHSAGDITLAGAGLWSIRSYMLGNYAGSGRHVYTLKDSGGTIIAAGSDAGGTDNRYDEVAFEAIVGPGSYYIDANNGSAELLGNTVASGLDRSTLVIQKLPDSTVVAYDPGEVEAKALTNDFVELSANQNFTAAYSDVLTLTLPEAGRYRVHAKVAAVYDTNAVPNLARLYNTTAGTEILGTEITLGDTDVASGNWQGTFSTEKVITVTGPTTVALQARGATTGANEMYSSSQGNTSLAYEQLPTTEVVTPGDVPVETLHRGVFRMSADWTNPSGNDAWQAIRFDTASHDTAGGFTPASYSYTIPADGDYHTDVVVSYRNNSNSSNDPQRVAVRLNGTSELLALQHDISDQLDADGWLPITLSGLLPGLTAGDVLTVEVFDADDAMIHLAADSSWSIQQLGGYTVSTISETSLPVDDQVDYIDLGTKRTQFGNDSATGVTAKTVTFPAAFADTTYSVVVTPTGGGNGQTITVQGKTTTGFTVTSVDINGTPQSPPFSWQAIGAKP